MNRKELDWAYEMYLSKSVQLRHSILLIVSLFLMLVLSLTASIILIPLKEKVPYLYAFDHASGEITKVGVLEPTTLSGNWALTRYLLIHYVTNFESYDAENIDVPYQMVWAQSNENVKKQYEEQVKSSNEKSPYRLYGQDKYVTVRVTAINQLNDNTVDVRLEKTLHDRATHSELVSQKEAIIKWEFSKAETSQKMLDRDPLGFKITYYQSTLVNIDNTQRK